MRPPKMKPSKRMEAEEPAARLIALLNEPPEGVKVLAAYTLPSGSGLDIRVTIWEGEDGLTRYYVKEPPITEAEAKAYRELFARLERVIPEMKLEGEAEKALIEKALELAETYRVPGARLDVRALAYYLARDSWYGPLKAFMADPNVEDITCVGPGAPFHVTHRGFTHRGLMETNLLLNEEELNALASRLAHMAGKHVSTAFPVLEAMLPEKHRVEVCYGREVTPCGTTINIRKFRERPYTVTELVRLGTLSPLMAAYLWLMVELKRVLLIAGPTASGKTTLLNALTSLTMPNWKVVTIEDTAELNVPFRVWESYVARTSYALSGAGEIGLEQLVRVSMRVRPDYVIVGEVRGREAFTMLQAAMTGHGCMCTIHAEDAETAMKRLTSQPIGVPPDMARVVDCVVIIKRARAGRKVLGIYEQDSEGRLNEVFKLAGDSFEPSSPEAVALRSRILKALDSPHRPMLDELAKRAKLLEDLARKGVEDPKQFDMELVNYYKATGRL